MKTCVNHPAKEAFSICHNCGKDYCELCLDKGTEFYYCKNRQCQAQLKEELLQGGLPPNVKCPSCQIELELSEAERISGEVHCPACEAFIDFRMSPPKVISRENYVELLSSFNAGDIGLIKSILESGNIDYYIFGEQFLNIYPAVQPARFYINENQLEEAKKLLKDFELHIWGASTTQYE